MALKVIAMMSKNVQVVLRQNFRNTAVTDICTTFWYITQCSLDNLLQKSFAIVTDFCENDA